MAYFLKKSKLKGRTYLSICESFYCHDKKGTAHKTYKSLGSLETHLSVGLVDPISHFQKEVDLLNEQTTNKKNVIIGSVSPIKHLGYFPLKSIINNLDIKKYIDYFKLTTSYQFDLYDILTALVYARSVHPCSKQRTFHEILPSLFESYDFTYDQLLDGLAFYGNEYEKIVELFTRQTTKYYGVDTNTTYFDCTNFYFEIDREDDFRRKGPSKEGRHDPIVGMGLLLDKNQIPIGMKLYPGNESEKPVLRSVIDDLKKQNNITGKTIHVADKGLNCAENIYKSLKHKDGYLFSKSVKMLPEIEKTWVLLDNDWKTIFGKNGQPIYKHKSCIDEFEYDFKDSDGKKRRVKIKEKRLVTFNYSLATKQRFEINKLMMKARALKSSQAKKSEYGDAAKYIKFSSINDDGSESSKKTKVTINEQAFENDLRLAGYNLLVTSELKMKDEEMYETYHNLWRIEESFRIMKSDLDARPVFLQKEETIKGHFLICYISVLLERIFQFKVLNNKYSTSEIYKFMKSFNIVKTQNEYINASINTDFLTDLSKITALPLDHYFLSETKIKMVINYKF